MIAVGRRPALAARARRSCRCRAPPGARSQAHAIGARAARAAVALDGASLGFIRQRVAAGQLPNFGRLLDRGAVIDLATLKPTQAEPVWAAAATGKYPPKNGIRSNALYRVTDDEWRRSSICCPTTALPTRSSIQGFVQSRAAHAGVAARAAAVGRSWPTTASRRASSDWPLTYAGRARRGYVLSDRFDEAASSPLRLADAAAPAIRRRPSTSRARPSTPGRRGRGRRCCPPLVARASPSRPDSSGRAGTARTARRPPSSSSSFAPRLTAVRYEGVDASATPTCATRSPSCSAIRATRSRTVRAGSLLRRSRRRNGPDDRRCWRPAICCSSSPASAWSPTALVKRLLARLLGEPDQSGTHEPAPDGFLLAYGTNVAPGRSSGAARSSISRRRCSTTWACRSGATWTASRARTCSVSSFTREHPVSYVATHERQLAMP